MRFLRFFFSFMVVFGITNTMLAQSHIDTLLQKRKLNLERNIELMNVSDADSLSINNIYNYNYDSDKLIKKELEKLQEQINEANSDLAEAYKTKANLENFRKRNSTVLIILIVSTIAFILLFLYFLAQYLAIKQRLYTAQVDVKQANENYSSASEAKFESEKILKEEIQQIKDNSNKLTQQLNTEKNQVNMLNNKIRRLEEENQKMKQELETKFEEETEKGKVEPDTEPVDTKKQLDEVEINLLKIEKLSKLKEIGNISKEEFEAVKNRILGSL